MNKPKISIILPVYNGQSWIARSVGSIYTQTFTDWECLLINDGSTDQSGALCDEWAQKDARFRVIHKPNGGISSARNAGLDAACGEYIAFCDQDDELSPYTLEYAWQVQQSEPDCFIWWDYTMQNEVFEANSQLPLRYTRVSRWEVEPFSHYTLVFSTIWNKLFHRDMLEKHHVRFDNKLGTKEHLGEDDNFWAQILQRQYGQENFYLAHIDLPLYYYQENQESLSHISHQEAIPIKDEEPPQPNYCKFLVEEYEEKFRRVSTFLENDPAQVACMVRNYMRSLAYALWSAQQLNEHLTKQDWNTAVLKKMMDWCKKSKVYIPYYIPFRIGSKRFISAYYYWDAQRSLWFWRFNWLFHQLLFRWREPAGVKR